MAVSSALAQPTLADGRPRPINVAKAVAGARDDHVLVVGRLLDTHGGHCSRERKKKKKKER